MKHKLILITGGSASGKTHLSNEIRSIFKSKVTLISQDRFYRETMGPRSNYDLPRAFDFKIQRKTLESLLQGKETSVPIYDFKNHCLSGYEKIQANEYIILEGIFAFFDKKTDKLANLKIFVDTPSDTRLSRRIVRDYNQRNRKLDNIIKRWLLHVQPSYDNYISKYKKESDIIVPWHKIKTRSLKSLISIIISLDKTLNEILNN